MITLRIPTKDQYAYVEVQAIGEGTLEEEAENVKKLYDKYIQTFQSEKKYSETTFNEIVCKIMDNDLVPIWADADGYMQLTDSQKSVIQAIKRFKKRLPVLDYETDEMKRFN